MKWIDVINLPSEEGFYWARRSGMQWWNYVVRVYGDAPFFRLDVWDYTNRVLVVNEIVYEIIEFGPKLADKRPDIVGKRDDWKS